MNVDHILQTFNACEVEYLLIGGMNFLLRHEAVLTYDIDFWIRDTAANLTCCDAALRQLEAAWGPTEDSWRPISQQSGWLTRQSVFCLTSPAGAIDIFRAVTGLPSWEACRARAVIGQTAALVEYHGLCDEDMIACQLALPEGQRRQTRVESLQRATSIRKQQGDQP